MPNTLSAPPESSTLQIPWGSSVWTNTARPPAPGSSAFSGAPTVESCGPLRPGVAHWHSVLETRLAIGCVYAHPLQCSVLLCSVWCQSPKLLKDGWAFPFGACESRGRSHS